MQADRSCYRIVNYNYAFIRATLMTPLLYEVHKTINKYLGKVLAKFITEPLDH